MEPASFLWHDYETFGGNPREDWPAQFAALRTDAALEPVGEPMSWFCRPPRDRLPSPDACLLTGITPQRAHREGLCEAEFAARIHEAMSEPGSCVSGYNSIRFDDEVTRNLFYRNGIDPYEREWARGNSRWDLIDLMRMAYALRPEGLEWAAREPGVPSFRLGDLAQANGVDAHGAHDALVDVELTLALARRVRRAQPRLWSWFLGLRDKRRVLGLLDPARGEPLLHISSRYPAARGCLAVVLPLAPHPTQPNGVIVVDLDTDPEPLLGLDADEIRDRVFVARTDLPEGVERIPLKCVHANRCPALAPLSALQGVDHARISLDLARALAHADRLRAAQPTLGARVTQVFAVPAREAHVEDVDAALYAGFLGDADRALWRRVRATPPERLGAERFDFTDPRCAELLFRYRARNFPDTLSADETERWRAHRRHRLVGRLVHGAPAIVHYRARLAELRDEGRDPVILDALEAWGEELIADLDDRSVIDQPEHAH